MTPQLHYCAVEVCECISNFVAFHNECNYLCWNLSYPSLTQLCCYPVNSNIDPVTMDVALKAEIQIDHLQTKSKHCESRTIYISWSVIHNRTYHRHNVHATFHHPFYVNFLDHLS